MISDKDKQSNYDVAIRLLAVMVRQYIEKHKDEPRAKGDEKHDETNLKVSATSYKNLI